MAAGSIVIDLLMKTSSFETDTKRAEKRLKEFEKTTRETATKVATAATAMAAAFAYTVKSTLDSMDAMSKMAQQAGVTVESLSALSYAADLSGVNTEALTQNLGRLSKGMSEAALGTGEALKAFKSLNIDVSKLTSADQALIKIADRFQGMEDGAQKTALAMQLFGRSGMQMIPFLNMGSEGINKLTGEAEALGVVLSTEAALAAEEFNDNVTRLQKGLEGLAISITTNMLPALNQLVSGLVNAQKTSLWGWLFTSGGEEQNATDSIGKLENTLQKARDSLTTHQEWQEQNPMFAWAVGGDITDLEGQIDFVENKLKYLRQVKTQQDEEYWRTRTINMPSSAIPMVDLTVAPTALGKPKTTGGGGQQIDKLKEMLATVKLISGEFAREQEHSLEMLRIRDVMVGMTEDQRRVQEVINQVLDETSNKLEEIAKQRLDAANAGANDNVLSQFDAQAEAVRKLGEEYVELARVQEASSVAAQRTFSFGWNVALNQYAEDATNAATVAKSTFDSLTGNLSSAINTFVDTGKLSFSDFANSVIKDIIKIQLQAQVSQIFSQIASIIGGAIGGSFGGGLGGATTMGAGSTAGGAGAVAFPVYAEGGYTGMGGKYEPAGVVHRGEYVMNANATNKLGVGFLDRLNKGYANGGYVGATSSAMASSVNVNIKNEAGGDGYKASATVNRNESGLNVDVIVRKVIANDLRNNGQIAQQMGSTFGLRRTI